MKNYLIDTHILLWWLSNDKRLNKKLKDLIANPDNKIFVSAVSFWEVAIKKFYNKLEAPDNLKDVVIDNKFLILDIKADHAWKTQVLPGIHKDPFDRILISQSICENLIFVTLDSNILNYKIKNILVFK